jgi:hypothetical protein
VTSDVTKIGLPLFECLSTTTHTPEECWVESYAIADLLRQEVGAQLAQPELPYELVMSIR